MRRVLTLISVMVIGCLVSSSAIAGVGIGGSLGYFSPAYGKINDDLEEINKEVGTHLELGGGLTLGLELSYDIGSNWRVRGEIFGFNSETSDSFYSYKEYDFDEDGVVDEIEIVDGTVDVEASLGALVLSGIYRVSPGRSFSPYVGLGVGLFSTELKVKPEGEVSWWDRWTEEWEEEPLRGDSDDTSSIGFQVLGGVEYKIGEKFSVVGEVRYISAKAEGLFKEEGSQGTDVDWSGLSFGLGASYRF